MTPYDDQIQASQDKERELTTLLEGTGLDSGTWLELRGLLKEITRENEDERRD